MVGGFEKLRNSAGPHLHEFQREIFESQDSQAKLFDLPLSKTEKQRKGATKLGVYIKKHWFKNN